MRLVAGSLLNPRLELDGITYPVMAVDSVPPGYGKVDVKLNDHSVIFDCLTATGHMSTIIEGEPDDGSGPI